MTVIVDTPAKIGPTEGNGSGTAYSSSPITFYDTDDILVVHTDDEGVETVVTEGSGATNYSIAFTDSSNLPSTLVVTYPASGSGGAALPSGEFLTLKRSVPFEQDVNLENQGGYFPDVQERALDEMVMRQIQIQEELNRALKAPVSDEATEFELPTVTERASKLLGFNAQGEPIATDAGIDEALVTDYTEELLLSADAQEAMQILAPDGILDLYNPAATEATSPNELEYTFQILGKADNDVDQEVIFSAIRGQIADETDGSEDGRILFSWMFNGVEDYYAKMGSGPTFQLISYSGSEVANPSIDLLRKSQTAADADLGGYIKWSFNHDGAETITGPFDGARIQAQLDDASEDSEDVHLEVYATIAGTDTEVLGIGGTVTVTAPNGITEGGNRFRPLKSHTVVATTSGTTHDFTGIGSACKRLTVTLNGVSLSSTDNLLLQLGTSGSPTTSGYVSTSARLDISAGSAGDEVDGTNTTSGLIISAGAANATVTGNITLINVSGNVWVANGTLMDGTVPDPIVMSGIVTLAGELDMVRLTRSGSNTFDAGAVGLLEE